MRIRLFNKHGNRQNKNTARLKFVIKDRGWDWVKETIESEYQDILANGGVPVPTEVPEGFGGFVTRPRHSVPTTCFPSLIRANRMPNSIAGSKAM